MLLVPLLIALMLYLIWYLFGARILILSFRWSQMPFEYFARLPEFLYPNGITYEYALVAKQLKTAHAYHYSWSTFVQILSLWGYTLRLLLIPCLVMMTIMKWRLPINHKYRRSLNLKQLADQNSELFPAIKVALGKNLHRSDPYSGPWRIADDYINFAAFNGLLLYKGSAVPAITEAQRGYTIAEKRRMLFRHFSYMNLDESKTDALFTNQLGLPWRGIDCLHPCVRALGVALMCMTAGGSHRSKGRNLLDQISATFTTTHRKEKPVYSCDLTHVNDLLSEVESIKPIQHILNSHAYTNTVFIALLIAARNKAGKVPPALFLWLRITDRTLWYTLHPIGGLKPWCEGAAGWCHHLTEQEIGKSVSTPSIEGATDALRTALAEEEWISAPFDSALSSAPNTSNDS